MEGEVGTRMNRMKTAALFMSVLLVAVMVAWGAADVQAAADHLTFEVVWARAASQGHMSAVYMSITNFGDEDVKIVAADSDVAETVEIHETTTEISFVDGRISQIMRMEEIPELTVESGATVELAPGGLHIMLIQLTHSIEEGDVFELTLKLDSGEHVTIDVPVTVGLGVDDDHEHHHH